MASKPFEIHVTLDAPELAQAISSLSLAIRDRIPVFQNSSNGAEVVIPAGAKMTVQDVQPAPVPAAPVQQAAPIPTVPAPVQQPVTAPPAPQPVQTVAPAPAVAPVQQTAPIPAAPVPVQQPVTAPTAPQAGAPSNVVQFPQQPQAAQVQSATQGGVTLDAIITAGAGLVEKGMMAQVISLLTKYNVPAVNQLQPAQFEPFAAELRALGAPI